MKILPSSAWALALTTSLACGGGAQEAGRSMVRSSDPQLGALAETLVLDLASRSGLELREPVRLEERSRDDLVRYLEAKLDEEMPEAEARSMVAAYGLLGLVPPDLDLRSVLLDLYTEQVAGFYDPDSTALFILDDQPQLMLQGLLVHELVHAIQDQTADLAALTDPSLGNDRQSAAQAAIEGHATLVMLEYLSEMSGAAVDLGQVPDFAARLRPALESMAQFPALAGAPRVIRESLLFPYLEGAGYVQRLWHEGEHTAPFGPYLPLSTEQVLTGDRGDAPVSLSITGSGVVHSDDLGRFETGIVLDTHLGGEAANLAEGWGGDRYALVETPAGEGLVWASVWDEREARDRFASALEGALDSFPAVATLDSLDLDGRPGVIVRIGVPRGVEVAVSVVR
ncbi:MAG: hypothetical protein P8170_11535 [Gemmatimonadota bacterium]|jgi:hypothetical protein